MTAVASRLSRQRPVIAGVILAALWHLTGFARAAVLDVDGNVPAATDGQLILRHLFGFSGDTQVDGAVSPDATRGTAAISAISRMIRGRSSGPRRRPSPMPTRRFGRCISGLVASTTTASTMDTTFALCVTDHDQPPRAAAGSAPGWYPAPAHRCMCRTGPC